MSLFDRIGSSGALGTGRAAILTSGLLAAVLAVPAAHAETGGSLRLARNDSGSIVQAIAIKEWRFDARTGELRVTSQGGARRCGISSGKQSDQTLILDGVRYPVERFRVAGKNEKRIEVTPVIVGEMFPLCVVPQASPGLVSAVSTKGSASGLNVELDVLGQPPSDLGVSDGIGYDVFAAPATISLGLTEDVLCLQGPGQGGVRLSVTDTNLITTNYQGFQSLDYRPFGGSGSAQPTLRAMTDGNPVCLAFPALAQVVTPETPASTCSPADIFFVDGFEDGGSPIGGPASTDLEIDLRLVENPNTTTLQNAVYELVVTNCGDNPATNVVVRDFYPTGGTQSGKPTRLGSGTWSCTSGATCADGSGYVDVNVGTLDPGATAVINVDRPLTAGNAGETLQVTASVAELDGNGENDPSDNIASWEFDVRDNELPAGTATGSCTIDEDSGTTDVAAAGCNNGEGYAIEVTDSDGTIAAVSATSLNTNILTVVGDPTFTGVGTDTITVTGLQVATVADANGSATVRVSITDDLGGIGNVDLSITVDAVNDPPTITVLGGFDYNGGDPIFAGPNCDQTSSTDCADQSYPASVGAFNATFADWVVAVSPGPADEAGQLTSVSIGAPSDPSLFIGASFEPSLIERVGGTWDLDYGLNGDSGTATVSITVTDDQAENNETVFSFDILVDNSPPVVSVTGAPNTIPEESVDETLSGGGFFVAASDPENDAVTISVTSSDQSLVADGDIVVDDADLNNIQITVTTQPNAFGIVDLSVVATDTVDSAPGIVSLTVDNVNDPPTVVFSDAATIEADGNVISFTAGDPPELTVNDAGGIQFIPNLVQVAGDAVLGENEGSIDALISNGVVVTVLSDPSGVLNGAPSADDNGQLAYVLASPAVAGSATLQITVTDNGSPNETSTPQELTFTVQTP
ncbi:MAG: hypothetical protein AAF358_25740 [Pseudomonadota bacterium]